MIDLRSDTLTLPTPAMRRAMFDAEVGDDGYEEDPSVKQLEETGAGLLGKEAGLFFTSGTQANLAALLTYCHRGHEVIMGDKSHIFLLEAGGSAAMGGIHPCPLPNQKNGTIALSDIKDAIRPNDKHFAKTRLICIENTQMICGGTILTANYTNQVCKLAHEHGLSVHLDGARIFNAAAKLEINVDELCHPVDSIMFSLSKGLSAPMGALLCGSHDFIQEVKLWRQMLGGGMHQAGVIASAGLVALNNGFPQLKIDNENARLFAEAIVDVPDFKLDLESVETNIVLWDLNSNHFSPEELVAKLEAKGIRIMSLGGSMLRAVTHNGINRKDIEKAIQIILKTMKNE